MTIKVTIVSSNRYRSQVIRDFLAHHLGPQYKVVVVNYLEQVRESVGEHGILMSDGTCIDKINRHDYGARFSGAQTAEELGVSYVGLPKFFFGGRLLARRVRRLAH